MELMFRETLPSDVEGLFSVRARTRENPISKEQLEALTFSRGSSSGSDLSAPTRYGWRLHRTLEHEHMAFIVPLDGGQMVKLTTMMTKSSSSSPANH